MKICKAKDCRIKHHAKGYCSRHYYHIKRWGKIKERTRRTPNEFIVKGKICFILLYDTLGKEKSKAIIDSEDLPKVKKYKWSLHQGSVATDINRKKIGLQHIVLDLKPNKNTQIDHIYHNTLDNRKSKLRLCSNKQNSHNRRIYNNNTSGYKGVYKAKDSKKYQAYITINYKKKHLGMYETKEEAALVYNKAATFYHKEFAKLNLVRRHKHFFKQNFPCNVGGYIGESTANEINYAKIQGKHIRFLEEI